MSKLVMYVINLNSRPEKFAHMTREFSSTFSLERFPAIDAKDHGITGREACKKSHYTLISQLKRNCPEYVIIAEDDLTKTKYFDIFWPRIYDYMISNHDWDLISLDPLLQFASFGRSVNMNKNSDTVFTLPNFRSTGFIIYSKRCIEKMILDETSKKEIDKLITHDSKLKKCTPHFLLTKQGIFSSDISPQEKNVDVYYKNTEIFLDQLRLACIVK
jgi:GR25 family glycosyltransferase involved in LPS biosynthesis